MGHEKSLLKINDKTFAELAYDALKSVCEKRITTVIREKKAKVMPEQLTATRYIYDLYENLGVLAGVHAALKECNSEFAIILACDMPFVTDKTIVQLAEIMLEQDADAVVPKQTDGRLQPLCAIYRVKECLSKLEVLLESKESKSAQHFLKKLRVKSIKQSRFDVTKDVFFNVNSLEDYNNL